MFTSSYTASAPADFRLSLAGKELTSTGRVIAHGTVEDAESEAELVHLAQRAALESVRSGDYDDTVLFLDDPAKATEALEVLGFTVTDDPDLVEVTLDDVRDVAPR